MSHLEVLIISLALALDAFGVSLSLGLDKRITKKSAIISIISSGFFQFLFVYIGGFFGCLFNRYIFTLPSMVGGVIIFFVGLLMIKEGFNKDENFKKLHILIIIFLGMTVSIDALVVGFSTFNILINKYILLKNSIIVGIVTSFLCLIAFFICKKIRRIEFFKEYADFLGGVILILFGIKMIFF
ncbi:MAG: hypothetical protein FH751_03485 [Firmicutes bacterium]|nr:hypothetical protein [Bacillota bacterium]